MADCGLWPKIKHYPPYRMEYGNDNVEAIRMSNLIEMGSLTSLPGSTTHSFQTLEFPQ